MTSAAVVKAAFEALLENHLDDLRIVLKTGMDVNAPATEAVQALAPSSIVVGDRLLHLGLWLENRAAVELLLLFNPDIGISARDGVTPLQMAIGKGMEDIAIWLIEAGASPLSVDHCGLSPIHYAKTPELMSLILNRNVPVDLLAQSTHWTPLHYAAYHDRAPIAQVLLAHGANAAALGRHGETPFHLLMAFNHRDVQPFGLLLEGAGANINATDDDGNTPLHWSQGAHSKKNWMDVGNPDAAGYLLDHGADPRARNRDGLSATYMAFYANNKEFRSAFLARQLKPSFLDTLNVNVLGRPF